MAGYPVQRGRPPVIIREAAGRRARDSGTLSGTSAAPVRSMGGRCICWGSGPVRLRPGLIGGLLGFVVAEEVRGLEPGPGGDLVDVVLPAGVPEPGQAGVGR
jgi:hypothetical protein